MDIKQPDNKDLFFNVASNNIIASNKTNFRGYTAPNSLVPDELPNIYNEGHINFTANNAGLLQRELIDFVDHSLFVNPGSVSNTLAAGYYNYGKFGLEAGQGTTTRLGKIKVSGAGKLLINANRGIGLNTAGNSSPTAGSIFSVNVNGNNNCGARAIVDIADGGQFILGETSVNNRGVIIFREGSALRINKAGKLEINANSKVIIESGGTLMINANADLLVKGTGSITVKAGGFICIEPSAIIKLQDASSKIIIEPGAIVGSNNSITGLIGNCLSLDQIVILGNGTIGNATVNAIVFDGEDDKVTVADNPAINFGAGDFTVEVKIQSSFIGSSSNLQVLLSKRSFVDESVSDGFLLGIFENGIPFIQLSGSPNHLFTRSVFDGACHLLSISRSGSNISLYIDGSLAGTSVSTRNINSSGPLHFGFDAPTSLGFTGEMGEVRLWRRALAQTEITTNIDTEYEGTENQLAGLWDMNREEEGLATDKVNALTALFGIGFEADVADPQWTKNIACSSSMTNFRTNGNTVIARGKDFITDEKPVGNPYDSSKVSTTTIKSFPNPATDEVNFYVKSIKNEKMSMTIFDAYGMQMMQNDSYQTNELIVIPNEWKTGVYIVRVKYGGVTDETKILKIE